MGDAAGDNLAARNLPQKTFVSLLQEIAVENGRKCKFDVVATEAQVVHQPTFVYRAELSDYAHFGEGRGKNKKDAKHRAAAALLDRLLADETEDLQILGAEGLTRPEVVAYLHSLMPELGVFEGQQADTVEVTEHSAAQASGETPAGGVNPVQALHEMIARRKWPVANYKDGTTRGEQHERVFEIECHVGRFMRSGEGKTKKLAKKEAAEKMLFFLRDIPLEIELELAPDVEGGQENPKKEETAEETKLNDGENAETGQKVTKIGAEKGQKTLTAAKNRLEIIRTRDFALETPSEEHLCLLEQIASQRNWGKPIFKPLEHRGTILDEHFGILEIPGPGNPPVDKNSILPIRAEGSGPTQVSALYHCAMNALHIIAVS